MFSASIFAPVQGGNRHHCRLAIKRPVAGKTCARGLLFQLEHV